MEHLQTIRAIADTLDISQKIVIDKVKQVFPSRIKKGDITYLNDYETSVVKAMIDDDGEPQPTAAEIAILQKELEHLKAENKRLAPLAALAEIALVDESVHYSITQAAKYLGLRNSVIFGILNNHNMLTKEGLPTQISIDTGILQIRTYTGKSKGGAKIACMTMQNMYNFKKKYLRRNTLQ